MNLITKNPIALQTLMSEALFSIREEVKDSSTGQSLQTASVEPLGVKDLFEYRGDRTTGVLFILRYPQYPYFSPEAEAAFVKTIGALNLTMANVAIVNLANPDNPNDWKLIMEFFQPKKITLLGVDPRSLKLPLIAHNSYMKGRVSVVFNTFSFEEMFSDLSKKKLFWNEFKTFIGA